MTKINEILGKNLSDLRKEKKLSQSELSEEIGINSKSISKWEQGKAIPSVEDLKKFADFYSLTIDQLISKPIIAKNVINKKDTINKTNKILAISMIASFVWFTATCIYINQILQYNNLNAWLFFIYAIPLSCLLCGVFTLFFFKKNLASLILFSIFLWSFLLSVALYYHLIIKQEIWYILLVAIPLQVTLFLFSKIKK